MAEVRVTALTFEGEFDSFAGTCTCLLPKETRGRDLKLSLALHSNEAAVHKAIKQLSGIEVTVHSPCHFCCQEIYCQTAVHPPPCRRRTEGRQQRPKSLFTSL